MSSKDLSYEQTVLKLDYSGKGILRMNLNENLVFPLNRLRSIIARCIDKYDPRYYSLQLAGEFLESAEVRALSGEIANYCKCPTGSVGIGFGADQVLDLVFKMKLGRQSGGLLTVSPSYSMYSVLANRLRKPIYYVNLSSSTGKEPFSFSNEIIIKKAKKRAEVRMLVIASPNNPTGIQYPLDQISSLIESLPDLTIVIDEAYVEYGEYTIANLFSKFKNLIVVRTFSKAFCLANLRLGYFLSSDTELVTRFYEEYQYPFPVSGFSVLMGTEMLRRKSLVLEYVEKTKTYRSELTSSLVILGLDVIRSSNSNFVLIRSKKSKKIGEDLLNKFAIAVKYLSNLTAEGDFLRITIGTREMNQKLVYALRRISSG